MSVSSQTKKIKKVPKASPLVDSPKNDSDEVAHFKPMSSIDLMVGNYMLMRHIADGTFGRVYEVSSLEKSKGGSFALKIVKATKNCVNNAKVYK